MPNVRTLSLSENEIDSMAPFRGLVHLEELFLRGNNISDLAEVAFLRGLRSLRVLWLQDNPCARTRFYRPFIAALLPHLTTLDATSITESERREGMTIWKDPDVRTTRHRAAALLRADGASAAAPPGVPSAHPPPPPEGPAHARDPMAEDDGGSEDGPLPVARGGSEPRPTESDDRSRADGDSLRAQKLNNAMQVSMVRAVEELLLAMDSEHVCRVQDICTTLLGPKA
jgi:hypothetical protein